MSYTIAVADIDTDKEDILRILTENIGTADDYERFERRLNWFYLENVAGAGGLYLLKHATEAAAGENVGCAGFAPRRFRISGSDHTSNLFADFAVDKAHRSLRPALTLQKQALQDAKNYNDFCYGFPNAAALPVLIRTGFKKVGEIQRFVKILRHENYIKQKLPIGLIAKIGGLVVDGMCRIKGFFKRRFIPGNYRLEWLSDFDDRFDALWNDVKDDYTILSHRTSDAMRWRYGGTSYKPGEIAALVDQKSNKLLAYAIVIHYDDNIASIGDFFGRDMEMTGHLFAHLTPAVRKRGYSSMDIYFFGNVNIVNAIKKQGFVFRNTSNNLVFSGCANGMDFSEHLRSADNWYITKFDTDC